MSQNKIKFVPFNDFKIIEKHSKNSLNKPKNNVLTFAENYNLYFVKSKSSISNLVKEFSKITNENFKETNFVIFRDDSTKLVELHESEVKKLLNSNFEITKFQIRKLPVSKTFGLLFKSKSSLEVVTSTIELELSECYRWEVPKFTITQEKSIFFITLEKETLKDYSMMKFMLEGIKIKHEFIKLFWKRNPRNGNRRTFNKEIHRKDAFHHEDGDYYSDEFNPCNMFWRDGIDGWNY